MRFDKRNPSAEIPRRLGIFIEHKASPLWPEEVGLGVLLVVELGTVVMLVQETLDGIVKVEERVKSMHYRRWGR